MITAQQLREEFDKDIMGGYEDWFKYTEHWLEMFIKRNALKLLAGNPIVFSYEKMQPEIESDSPAHQMMARHMDKVIEHLKENGFNAQYNTGDTIQIWLPTEGVYVFTNGGIVHDYRR